jgi:hypothetical protein
LKLWLEPDLSALRYQPNLYSLLFEDPIG